MRGPAAPRCFCPFSYSIGGGGPEGRGHPTALFICFPSVSGHPNGIHHAMLRHGPHTGQSVPVLPNRLKDPRKLRSFPVLFSSQVVFPHHRPHGHLHIHRSHSGLRWPLLCLGESPFHTLWRVPSLTWKVGLTSPEAKRMQIARSPGPGPLLLTSV